MHWLFLWVIGFGVVDARNEVKMKVPVLGVEREFLVFPPVEAKESESVPVVFCFHGHGGGSMQAAKSFGMHDTWPEALVVYPQGLPTPGQLTDPEGKRNGWQSKSGDQQDRDLLFFDEMLMELAKTYQIDSKQVFVMGHSNGGGFTYLLWAYRGDKITAVAPCAALSVRVVGELRPKPCMHIAARNDELVKFEWQERMIKVVKNVNGCRNEGEKWAEDCTIYKPKNEATGAAMVEYIHNGTHKYPEHATAKICRFFKEVGAKK